MSLPGKEMVIVDEPVYGTSPIRRWLREVVIAMYMYDEHKRFVEDISICDERLTERLLP